MHDPIHTLLGDGEWPRQPERTPREALPHMETVPIRRRDPSLGDKLGDTCFVAALVIISPLLRLHDWLRPSLNPEGGESLPPRWRWQAKRDHR